MHQGMGNIMERIFQRIASVCVSWPWEVIFSIITLTLVMITCIDDTHIAPANEQDDSGVDAFMNALIIVSLLYTFNEFHSLIGRHSRCLHGIAVLLVFSTFICCSAVIKILKYDFADLKNAICFSLLLFNSNVKQAIDLADYTLASSSYSEVQKRMEKGLAKHGPSKSLDAILLLLLLRCGILSELLWLKKLSEFALMSVAANYAVLMTFYPAYLSLALEISNRGSSGSAPWGDSKFAIKLDEVDSNPLVKSVKIIMSTGLGLVHCITKFQSPKIIEERIKSVQDVEVAGQNLFSSWLNDELASFTLIVILIVFFILRGVRSSSPVMIDASTQASLPVTPTAAEKVFTESATDPKTLEECLEIFKQKDGVFCLKDEEILLLAQKGNLPMRSLEETLRDPSRAVRIRRKLISPKLTCPDALDKIAYENYDYSKVRGQCCENVIGYAQVPLGLAGPLKVNGKEYMIPMATTEGALVASTSRGCKALSQSEAGVNSYIFRDGMTRAPLVQFPNAGKALEAFKWIKIPSNFLLLKEAFDGTSNYAKLQEIHPTPVNKMLFIRFVSTTGDAMGMNMVAKGTEAALKILKQHFDEMEILSISGNLCTDKKPSAINWIMGRGKSVICDAVLPSTVVKSVLKTSVKELVDNNTKKNFVGSSMAGSIGGNNAHAANIVAAMFIACGQDTAQVVESSTCLTYLESCGHKNEDLYVSVTMPSLEVGTVGGGTILESQTGCLQILGIKGSSKETSGDNARQLAKMVASAVMAGELSLMASLTQQTLVKTHLDLNRKMNTQTPT